ncbi:MAG: 2-dehydro-3-deoxygalactonokinase [Cyclobacteriaceae bacterium]|jgi:2-dehydro-3-deoxygalactonokinase
MNQFISVDWGTSNFRARLVEVPSLHILEEVKSSQGIKETFTLWQEQGGDQESFFLDFIKTQFEKFISQIEAHVRVVISGMASSTIGLRELPYADLPFNSDGSTLYIESIQKADFSEDVVLISGVKSSSDVIRGEEVQVVGLMSEEDKHGTSIFILPGTHSKHVICENGIVTDFKTYMTGELFDVLSKQTILKNSITSVPTSKNEFLSFDEGVKRSIEGGSLLNEIFKIRAFDLFESKSKGENFYYLSGLLIGDEMNSLQKSGPDKINLCAGGGLYELYHRSLDQLGLMEKTKVIPKDLVDASVVKGQWKVLENNI